MERRLWVKVYKSTDQSTWSQTQVYANNDLTCKLKIYFSFPFSNEYLVYVSEHNCFEYKILRNNIKWNRIKVI